MSAAFFIGGDALFTGIERRIGDAVAVGHGLTVGTRGKGMQQAGNGQQCHGNPRQQSHSHNSPSYTLRQRKLGIDNGVAVPASDILFDLATYQHYRRFFGV